MSLWTPKYPNTQMKSTKAIATQNSASSIVRSSALERFGDRSGHLLATGHGADQPFHDRAGGFRRDILHVAHRCCPLVGDDLLGLANAGIERGIQRLAIGFRLGGRLLAGLIG